MKRLTGLFLVFALLFVQLFACGAFAEEAAPGLQKDLIILFTSDIHCGISQGWGLAGLYAVKQSLSRTNHVLLVDDGDAIQGEAVGTLTTGEAVIDVMNTMGYDAAIPGNHEFDFGMERFLELTEKANFPYLSCNFNREGTLVFRPWMIREIDGVKIGFVGITTPETLRSSTPAYFMDENGKFIYGFMQDATGETLYTAVQKAVDEVREAGADYVIALAHLGNEGSSSPWMYSDVISHTSGIDALLDGHSHDTEQVVMKNRDGEDVIRSACGTKLQHIGALTIRTDGSMKSELFSWDASLPAPELLGLSNPAGDAAAAAMTKVEELRRTAVAKSAVDLIIYDPDAVTEDGGQVRIVRSAETNLGDLCADAFRIQAGADIGYKGGGSIRVQLPAGDLTFNDFYNVHPFGNSLAMIEVTGQQVLDALEWGVHSMPQEFGGFPQVSGLTFEIDVSVPSPCLTDENGMFDRVEEGAERRVRNVLVGGEPLDPEKIYTLAGDNYTLLNYGDGYTMFGGAPVLLNGSTLDHQVLVDYITDRLGGVINEGYADPYGQGRIVSVPAE